MNAIATIPTNNPDRGFWGTMSRRADPAAAWSLAVAAIGDVTFCPDAAVRDFLDSTHGRHFADDVANCLVAGLTLPAAIEAAVERWMAWTISRSTERETGIPRGLPYLTGHVTWFEVHADLAHDAPLSRDDQFRDRLPAGELVDGLHRLDGEAAEDPPHLGRVVQGHQEAPLKAL